MPRRSTNKPVIGVVEQTLRRRRLVIERRIKRLSGELAARDVLLIELEQRHAELAQIDRAIAAVAT